MGYGDHHHKALLSLGESEDTGINFHCSVRRTPTRRFIVFDGVEELLRCFGVHKACLFHLVTFWRCRREPIAGGRESRLRKSKKN